MMRKIIIVLGFVLMLSLTVANAQDTVHQSPIIALADGKLYAVSPDDGSAKVLVEPAAAQTIAPLRIGSISPDGKYLVYVSQYSLDDAPDQYLSDFFIVTLANGKVEKVRPSGGVFDLPAPKGNMFQIDLPTWSFDGQRIYYYRSQFGTGNRGENKPIQLVYYDVSTRKHQLVARIDPHQLLDNLQAVPSGMIARWYTAGFNSTTTSTLYAANNQMVKQIELGNPFLFALRDADGEYFAQLKDFGDIESMLNVATGDETPTELCYYPAAQSLSNSDQSMHVFSVQSSINTYYVYGADYKTYITSVDNTYGFSYALSPDGQQLAYLQFDGELRAPIQILDMKGHVRQLDFTAEQILWGAVTYVPFYAPG